MLIKIIMVIWITNTNQLPETLKSQDSFTDIAVCQQERLKRSELILDEIAKKVPKGKNVVLLSGCLTPEQEPDAIKAAAQIYAKSKWKDSHPDEAPDEKVFKDPEKDPFVRSPSDRDI
jgi:hypothetical protein